MDDDLLDRMTQAFYDKGVEQDGRTFKWHQLSESLRERYRQRLRAALAVANEGNTDEHNERT